MKKLTFIAFVLVVAVTSCRNKKEVVQVTTVTVPASETTMIAPVTKPVKTGEADTTAKVENYRFIVSFYSIGEGVDAFSHRKFIAYLLDYKRKNKAVYAEEAPWGREGEVDYCMKLIELNAVEQADFIKNLKTELVEARWVHYYENKPCDKKGWGK